MGVFLLQVPGIFVEKMVVPLGWRDIYRCLTPPVGAL